MLIVIIGMIVNTWIITSSDYLSVPAAVVLGINIFFMLIGFGRDATRSQGGKGADGKGRRLFNMQSTQKQTNH